MCARPVVSALGFGVHRHVFDLHARIDAVLRENEYRMDFVREAVERELKRRERAMAAARRQQSR
jgi:hypothetical protein